MNTTDKIINEARQRVAVVRVRTWTLTLAILVSLALYIFVNITLRQSLNVVDFVFLCLVQILVHLIYFPDGDLFGQTDKVFISNKDAYNSKAKGISLERLREYCEYEFEQRRQEYVRTQCALIGITVDELENLKDHTEEEIMKLDKVVVKVKDKDVIVPLSKTKRKMLRALIFEPLPVRKNRPEVITSAIDSKDESGEIKDKSIAYKKQENIKKFCITTILGLFFGFVAFKIIEGFGFAQIIQICMYLTTIFSTAVTSYTSGENCSRVYKSRFYLELSNFIDGFNEWNGTQNNIRILLKKDGE